MGLSLAVSPQLANIHQMLMPHRVSRLRSLFAIIRHPRNYFPKTGWVSAASALELVELSARVCVGILVQTLLQVLASRMRAQNGRGVNEAELAPATGVWSKITREGFQMLPRGNV